MYIVYVHYLFHDIQLSRFIDNTNTNIQIRYVYSLWSLYIVMKNKEKNCLPNGFEMASPVLRIRSLQLAGTIYVLYRLLGNDQTLPNGYMWIIILWYSMCIIYFRPYLHFLRKRYFLFFFYLFF